MKPYLQTIYTLVLEQDYTIRTILCHPDNYGAVCQVLEDLYGVYYAYTEINILTYKGCLLETCSMSSDYRDKVNMIVRYNMQHLIYRYEPMFDPLKFPNPPYVKDKSLLSDTYYLYN